MNKQRSQSNRPCRGYVFFQRLLRVFVTGPPVLLMLSRDSTRAYPFVRLAAALDFLNHCN